MKIAVISTTVLPCPPPGYGGLEAIAYHCAVGLARRGHQVLLIAPNTSPAIPGVEIHGTTQGESEQAAFGGYWHRLVNNVDAVIDHSWNKWSYMLKVEGKLRAPVLGVLHAPAHTMYQQAPPILLPCLVAISEDQAAHVRELWGVPARVAYNGIDLNHYAAKPGITRGDRYLFLARISTIKGPHIAVDLARQLRFGLDIVGDDTITGEPALAQRVRALAVNNIAYHGPCSREKAVDWFSQAKALLHPAFPFREPFGLSPVEAQAAGCGVIASDHGALRETIKHGETGFLCKTPEEMAEYIKTDAVRSIRPEACRENASRFSLQAMTLRYEALCQEAIEVGW
jgi:glycosyltransferase involved in cell wall biosynthesis